MSHPPYSPVPQANNEDALLGHEPLSPGFRSPMRESFDIPAGAASPRFLGQATYNDEIRASYADSQHTTSMNHYAEEMHQVEPTNASATMLRYSDDPNAATRASAIPIPMSPLGSPYPRETKGAYPLPPRSRKRRNVIIVAVVLSLILVAAAVIIPVYFTVIKKDSNDRSGSSSSDSDSKSSGDEKGSTDKDGKPAARLVTGHDGSEITMDDGTKFTYTNPHGGVWYWDENDPFNNGARAQSWSPALNETFRYGVDKIRGVNVGGWLVLEPFICPAMFQPHITKTPAAIDEYTLHQHISAEELEEHYKTFITEKDFADIAGAGLNYVRVPIGFWAIETIQGEPYHAHISWQYFLKAIQWARKYGLRINLDYHGAPGSQNAWNHSGRLGPANWLVGPMGVVNGQRTLEHIRTITQFISQPQYKDVVTMFGILNEPQVDFVGREALDAFYVEAYKIIRTAGGTGEGNGPWISYHTGFTPRANWDGWMPNADRISLDMHPYLCFNTQSPDPIKAYARIPCTAWGGLVNSSMAAFGLNNAGEFSNAVVDCGLWLNGVNQGARYENKFTFETTTPIGSCATVIDYPSWTADEKNDIKNLAMASMDALQNYFFWTWKIGASRDSGKIESPHWSYQLGLQEGWMPTDPRQADGYCGNSDPFLGGLPPAATGGVGAGNIPQAFMDSHPWPPATLKTGGDVTAIPVYTATGTRSPLPGPTFTGTASVNAGNGWANPSDTAGHLVPVASCTYLDPYVGPTASPPPVCR